MNITLIAPILSSNAGACMAALKVDLPFMPVVGTTVENPAWSGGKKVICIDLEIDSAKSRAEGWLQNAFVRIEPVNCRDKAELEAIKSAYADHGWNVS